jgi:hypothetical protein
MTQDLVLLNELNGTKKKRKKKKKKKKRLKSLDSRAADRQAWCRKEREGRQYGNLNERMMRPINHVTRRPIIMRVLTERGRWDI